MEKIEDLINQLIAENIEQVLTHTKIAVLPQLDKIKMG